ncbi:lactate utilization protein [Chloroflexota bacterium]
MLTDMSQSIELTLKSLKANNFDTHFVHTSSEAREKILGMIPLTARVGVGDSATLRQIGILEELTQRRTDVINPFTHELTQGIIENTNKRRLFHQMQKKTLDTDVFLTGSNALTEDGKLVNIDRIGNRVTGMIFGAENVILVIGRNKIVKDIDAAIYRIKNVLAPVHAARKNNKTPCASTGKCNDCNSPSRLCNITVIIEKQLTHSHLSVILIDKDLGLGWDPVWDEKRISNIRSNYYQNTWVFF